MSSRSTQIIGGGDRERAYVDGIHNGLISTEERHHKTHEGELFTTSFVDTDIAKDGIVYFEATVPAGIEVHTKLTVAVSGAFMLTIIEDPTVASSAAVAEPTNRNRSVVGLSAVSLGETLVGLAGGTVLQQTFLPGGFGTFAQGFMYEPEQEWVLSAGSVIVFQLENLSDNAGAIATLNLDIYAADEA